MEDNCDIDVCDSNEGEYDNHSTINNEGMQTIHSTSSENNGNNKQEHVIDQNQLGDLKKVKQGLD